MPAKEFKILNHVFELIFVVEIVCFLLDGYYG